MYTSDDMDEMVNNYQNGQPTFGTSVSPQPQPSYLPGVDNEVPRYVAPAVDPVIQAYNQKVGNIAINGVPMHLDTGGTSPTDTPTPSPMGVRPREKVDLENIDPNLLTDGQTVAAPPSQQSFNEGKQEFGAVPQAPIEPHKPFIPPTPAAQQQSQNDEEDNTDENKLPYNMDNLNPKEQVILKQMINGYTNSADPKAIEQAKMARSRARLVGGIGAGLDEMFTSRSVAHGGPEPDNSYWQNIADQGQTDLDEAKQDYADKKKDYLTKVGLQQTGSQIYAGQQKQQLAEASRDPNSSISLRTYDAVTSIYPQLKDQLPRGTVSAEEFQDLILPTMKTKAQQDLASANATSLNEYRQGMLNKNTGKTESNKDKAIADWYKARAEEIKSDSATQQANVTPPAPPPPQTDEEQKDIRPISPPLDQQTPAQAEAVRNGTMRPPPSIPYHTAFGKPGKQFVQTNSGAILTAQQAHQNANALGNDITRSRSEPDVNQAKTDRYLVSKAQMIINDFNNKFGHQPMSPDKYKLLNLELAKIASGGAAHEATLEGIDANALSARLAKFQQGMSSVPADAGVDQFVKGAQQYLIGIESNASKTIEDNVNKKILLKRGGISDAQEAAAKEAVPEVYAPYAAIKSKNVEAPMNYNQEETIKTVNGEKYYKVPGGWRKQK